MQNVAVAVFDIIVIVIVAVVVILVAVTGTCHQSEVTMYSCIRISSPSLAAL